MSSNYPPGAANDPNAPYNQEDPPVVEVTVREMLIKETSISSCCGHWVNDYEYDPDEGRSVGTSYYDEGNVAEDFQNQQRYAFQCLRDCAKVLPVMLKELNDYRKLLGLKPSRIIEHIYVDELARDCEDWECEESDVAT